MNPTGLVSPDGEELPHERPTSVKRLVFDYSSVVAIVMVVITWATLLGDVRRNAIDIAKLQKSDDARTEERVYIAREMATKSDINSLSAKFEAFASEMRARTNK